MLFCILIRFNYGFFVVIVVVDRPDNESCDSRVHLIARALCSEIEFHGKFICDTQHSVSNHVKKHKFSCAPNRRREMNGKINREIWSSRVTPTLIISFLLLRLGRAIEITAVCAYTERERTTESMERRMGHSSLGNENFEKKYRWVVGRKKVYNSHHLFCSFSFFFIFCVVRFNLIVRLTLECYAGSLKYRVSFFLFSLSHESSPASEL